MQYSFDMKRDHSFVWTPDSLNCAVCDGGHHPWDGIGEDEQRRIDKPREAPLEEEVYTHRDIFNLRWVL